MLELIRITSTLNSLWVSLEMEEAKEWKKGPVDDVAEAGGVIGVGSTLNIIFL